jgi:hypothetical protein
MSNWKRLPGILDNEVAINKHYVTRLHGGKGQTFFIQGDREWHPLHLKLDTSCVHSSDVYSNSLEFKIYILMSRGNVPRSSNRRRPQHTTLIHKTKENSLQ